MRRLRERVERERRKKVRDLARAASVHLRTLVTGGDGGVGGRCVHTSLLYCSSTP